MTWWLFGPELTATTGPGSRVELRPSSTASPTCETASLGSKAVSTVPSPSSTPCPAGDGDEDELDMPTGEYSTALDAVRAALESCRRTTA